MKRDVRDELIRQAIEIRQRAYAPYSKFLVGAAVRTASGKTFLGCNVENASYGLAVCAERSAVFAAITAGEKQFECMAIATQGGAMPCGACRQVLSEFNPDLPIFIVDVDNPDEDRRRQPVGPAARGVHADDDGKSKVQRPKSKVKAARPESE